MIVTKPVINEVEFYITNVCNYNCDNCNRLNNYYFSGHQLWKDYANVYSEWSKKIDISKISILGGEPLLNPSLMDWLVGLRELWPSAAINIVSNGTRLKHWKNLYQSLQDNNINLRIACHNRTRYNGLLNEVVEWLQHPISKTYKGDFSNWVHTYNQVKDSSWPNCQTVDDFHLLPNYIQDECKNVHKIDPESYLKNTSGVVLRDANGVEILLSYYENFVTSPLLYAGDNKFQVYNSDPTQAHNVCISKYCHHFIKGKLYKCHHVALLPMFMEQFHVMISPEDQLLLNSYAPLTVDADDQTIVEFFGNIRNEIPQCKLCPASLDNYYLQSSTKKPKVIKIQHNLNKH